jgi:hypothetical protein
MRECGRRVSFLIAEKSMHQRGIGMFARMINASKSHCTVWGKEEIDNWDIMSQFPPQKISSFYAQQTMEILTSRMSISVIF